MYVYTHVAGVCIRIYMSVWESVCVDDAEAPSLSVCNVDSWHAVVLWTLIYCNTLRHGEVYFD